jgi:hypothetical protein
MPVLYGDCSYLAARVAERRRHMQGQNDPFESLIYRSLVKQYEQCLRRFSFGSFGVYAVNDGLPFDTP